MIDPNQLNTPASDKNEQEQSWENPNDPERASDIRDLEQLERQKKEAELRKNNLTEKKERGEE